MNLREEMKPLLSSFPSSSVGKYEKLTDDSSDYDKANTLVKLLSHYKGEAVEASPGSSVWVLEEGPCPEMPPKGGKQPWQHKQYLCYQPLAPAPGRAKGGKKGSRKGYWEEGLLEPESIPGGSYEFGKSMVLPPRGRASWLETDVDYPDWTNQRHRCFVPCLHTQEFHWVCEVLLIYLGMLFKCRHIAKWREEDVDALKETKVKEQRQMETFAKRQQAESHECSFWKAWVHIAK